MTLDYFKIEQSDVVFQSPEYVINQAYIAQNPKYANSIIRGEGGKGPIVSVYAPNDNIAERTVAGLDFSMQYQLSSSIGEWDFNVELSHFLDFEVQDTADSPSRSIIGEYDNSFGNIPKDRANLTIGWNMDDWTATYNVEYIAATTEPNDHVMSASNFHHMQVDYHYDDLGIDFHFGVKNLWDKEPPLRYAGTNGVDYNTYSLRGRFFYLGLAKTF